MLKLRFHSDPFSASLSSGFAPVPNSQGPSHSNPAASSGPRFNVLLAHDRPGTDTNTHWGHQLPRLLAPQGIAAFQAHTGRQAVQLAEKIALHAAVVDLLTPIDPTNPSAGPAPVGGLWLLELFKRIPNRPPVVIVFDRRKHSTRQADFMMREALRLGAFSVVNRPTDLEDLLAVFQRLIERRYRGEWPANPGSPGEQHQE